MNAQHHEHPDGYCSTCMTVPCQLRVRPRSKHGQTAQLDRIELKLNRLLRAAGIDPDNLTQQPEEKPA